MSPNLKILHPAGGLDVVASAAARVEYILVVLVDVVATADKREEGGPRVCPSVAQMSLSVTALKNE